MRATGSPPDRRSRTLPPTCSSPHSACAPRSSSRSARSGSRRARARARATSFTGEQKAVSQTISKLQSEATGGEASKICKQILSAAIVAQLQASPGGCQHGIKSQLGEIDNFELTTQSVQIAGSAAKPTATAVVKSLHSGKSRPSSLTLVKEGGAWKVSGLG